MGMKLGVTAIEVSAESDRRKGDRFDEGALIDDRKTEVGRSMEICGVATGKKEFLEEGD